MGTGHIPWIAVDTYAIRNGYAHNETEYESFMYLIEELDKEYMLKAIADYDAEKSRSGQSRPIRKPYKKAR